MVVHVLAICGGAARPEGMDRSVGDDTIRIRGCTVRRAAALCSRRIRAAERLRAAGAGRTTRASLSVVSVCAPPGELRARGGSAICQRKICLAGPGTPAAAIAQRQWRPGPSTSPLTGRVGKVAGSLGSRGAKMCQWRPGRVAGC